MPRTNSFSKTLFSGCLLFLTSCGPREEKLTIAKLAEQFVYQSLAFNPVAATSAGYHTHHGVPLDQLLDDMSEQGFSQQREFYLATRKELAKLDENSPDAEMDADGAIIRNQVELTLLELTEIQSYKHNPTLYVETVGNGLFNLYALESHPRRKDSATSSPAWKKFIA